KSDHHQIVGIHLALLFVDNNLSLLVKHKGDAALSSDAAVSLGERASDISCSTVLVVGERFHDDRDSVRSISLICYMLVVIAVGISGSFFDAALDGIVRHVVCLCLCDYVAKLAVICRIGTALFYGDYDFTSDDCEDFTLLCVIFLFLMLNVGKFRMS